MRWTGEYARYTCDVALQEKDEMLKYVVEEVDRLKAMYEERLARAAAERNAAAAAEKQAAERLSSRGGLRRQGGLLMRRRLPAA